MRWRGGGTVLSFNRFAKKIYQVEKRSKENPRKPPLFFASLLSHLSLPPSIPPPPPQLPSTPASPNFVAHRMTFPQSLFPFPPPPPLPLHAHALAHASMRAFNAVISPCPLHTCPRPPAFPCVLFAYNTDTTPTHLSHCLRLPQPPPYTFASPPTKMFQEGSGAVARR